MPKRYYWLKFQRDFFSSKRIKKLRKLAGGDTYTIIYLKMQLFSIPTDGVLTYTGLEESFAKELALDLDEEPENVEITLQYLLSCGLMETSDSKEFFMPYVAQNIGSEGDSAERVRNHRERLKALQCNDDVTQVKRLCNVEKEREIEEDIEKNTLSKDKVCSADAQRVIDAWNDLPSVPKVRRLMPTSNRYKMLAARIRDYGIDDVLLAVENVKNSPFLLGDNRRNWQIDFDWFVKPNNFPKVLDGNYTKGGAAVAEETSVPKRRLTAEEVDNMEGYY